MKFNETIKKFSEELVRPNKELFWEFSDDYAYVWMVVMKKDHLLIVADGPPVGNNKKPKDSSILKRAVKYTKQTAIDLLRSVKRRITEEEEEMGAHGLPHAENIVAKTTVPFEVGSDGKLSYDDVVESKNIAKEIIEDSKFLYERFGVVSLEHDDFIKYGIRKRRDYNTPDEDDF